MPSIKNQIMSRVGVLLTTLVTATTAREAKRTKDIFLEAAKLPALHYVDGPERVTEQGEDTQGFTMQFPLFIECICADERDPHGTKDALVAAVQTAIEADRTLNSLANWCRYQGETPFVLEQTKPVVGSVVEYLVEYRRKIALPSTAY